MRQRNLHEALNAVFNIFIKNAATIAIPRCCDGLYNNTIIRYNVWKDYNPRAGVVKLQYLERVTETTKRMSLE